MFYGWWIVASVFTAQLFMVGFYTYCYPLIIVPVKEEFGASTIEVNLAMTFAGPVGLVLPPIVGPLVDRWTARGLMLIGAVALTSALILLSITEGIYQFAIVFAIFMGIANVLLGPITGSAVVTRWFVATRGRALGVAATGTSVGGVGLPLLTTWGLEVFGWRGTLQWLAAAVVLLVLPLLLFALRDHPADKGLEPDGSVRGPGAGGGPGDAAADRIWSNREIVTSRPFWLISCCLGLLFMSYTAVLSNLGLYVTSLGLHVSAGTTLITLIALFGFLGKLLFGYAADRIGLRPGLWGALALAAVGIGILSLEPAYPVMVAAAVCMGLAAGGMVPVWGAMIATVFGTASFGRSLGFMMPVITALVTPGFLIIGATKDATGSFGLALLLFVALLVIAAALLIPLRLPSEPAREETARGT